MIFNILVLSLFTELAANFRCPEKNGFFPDPEQCDLYYECVDNVAVLKLCPDGLMFDDTTSIDALCDYPFNVECGDREYVRKFTRQIHFSIRRIYSFHHNSERV